MNSYFCNIGAAMNQDIQKTPATNPNTIQHSDTDMTLPDTNNTEILSIINKLKNASSPGPDQIQTKLVKKCATQLTTPLVAIANSMLHTGCFPDKLKAAKVIPIHKDGDKNLCSNYRPISILSVFSKILESIFLNRILTFLKDQKSITTKQFGFCDKSSTQSAIINLLNSLQKNIDSKPNTYGALLFIDLSKAFDSINPELLLKKLEALGIRGTALKLIRSFLTDRKQFTYNGNIKSDIMSILFGVPQGGISSPILFNCFLNDIVNLPLKGKIILYADDICLSYTNTSLNTLSNDMQHDLNLLTNWFNYNQLTINAKKTKFMVLSPSHPPTLINPPNVSNTLIEQVKSFKYLGLIIDEQLKWQNHINHVINKIAPITGILWRTRHCTTLSVRRNIYYALIHSHLNYLIAVWGNAYKSHLLPLKTIQNKAIKIIYNFEWRKHTVDIYAQTGILNLSNLKIKNQSIILHQHEHNLIKTNITTRKINQTHSHNLRNASHYVIDPFRTHVGKSEPLRNAAITYNNLPQSLKSIVNLNTFKSHLKLHLIKQQITIANNQP
jgi:Reverse transcriptase (RNA-dependent DNA polymerase)